MTYDDFKFWSSGEWQVIEEKLADLKGNLCPKKENLFAALDATPFEDVKVVFCGQDPYPNPDYATGIAFSIPKGAKNVPVTLANILREYAEDTHYPPPGHGNLETWCRRGVLLWNAIPSCTAWSSLSHRDWPEWQYLNSELFENLSNRGVVFILSGGVARDLRKYINEDESEVIEVSHPSPRGNIASKTPFLGSRVFTRTNDLLCNLGKEPINWRL